jgi:hypothetical protein
MRKPMKIIDFEGVHEVTSVEELDTILKTRHGEGVNSFWLSHGSNAYPTLSILVNGDLAALNFIAEENDAGFRSISSMPKLKSNQTITFATSSSPADDVVVPNDAVLPFSTALKAAKDFFLSKELPRSVEWMEL